jgi:hypothetical protein
MEAVACLSSLPTSHRWLDSCRQPYRMPTQPSALLTDPVRSVSENPSSFPQSVARGVPQAPKWPDRPHTDLPTMKAPPSRPFQTSHNLTSPWPNSSTPSMQYCLLACCHMAGGPPRCPLLAHLRRHLQSGPAPTPQRTQPPSWGPSMPPTFEDYSSPPPMPSMFLFHLPQGPACVARKNVEIVRHVLQCGAPWGQCLHAGAPHLTDFWLATRPRLSTTPCTHPHLLLRLPPAKTEVPQLARMPRKEHSTRITAQATHRWCLVLGCHSGRGHNHHGAAPLPHPLGTLQLPAMAEPKIENADVECMVSQCFACFKS